MINSILNSNRIEYLIAHLNYYYSVHPKIINSIIYIDQIDSNSINNSKICILANNFEFEIVYYQQIPILFGNKEYSDLFFVEGKSVIICHDLLRSIFYLLSGYQEYSNKGRDKYQRYQSSQSIQSKLNMVRKPLVNYYFEFLIQGISKYAEMNGLPRPVLKFSRPILALSHDIDRLKYFDIHGLKNELKKVIKMRDIYSFFKFLSGYLKTNLFGKLDPFDTFDWILQQESSRNMNSTWFVLDKDIPHQDAYYRPNEKNILILLNKIIGKGHEIAIHGVIRSSFDSRFLHRQLSLLSRSIKYPIRGIRQHRLYYQHLFTPGIHENAQFKYDATLGFAEKAGFRNSICYPFKLYNFEYERAYFHWEIPLMVMDATLFNYELLNFLQARIVIDNLLDEVKKFNGVFSILWHNSYLNELTHAGIKNFYTSLLDKLYVFGESRTHTEIINMIDKD